MQHTSERIRSNDMHICLITAEPILATTVGDYLHDLNHATEHFRSTRELLDSNRAPELVFDVMIDEVVGSVQSARSSLSRLHDSYPDVPVIVMLTNAATLTPEDAVALGIHAYLRKPISLSELDLMLRRLPGGGRDTT
jgi:DNA-binding NtrC family response regulator